MVLLPSPQRVLDMGTGTGIWALEFGKGACILSNFILTIESSRQTSDGSGLWD